MGEGKIKAVIAEKIPDWFWDASLHDLRDFLDEMLKDPKSEEWWTFVKEVLRKILYDEE